MTEVNHSDRIRVGLFFLLVLCLTRPYQFSAFTHLPDATAAIFLLAACYLRRTVICLGGFVVVVLLDTLAVRQSGLGGHCITMAYTALFPAYAGAWCIGWYFASRYGQPSWHSPVWLVSTLLAGWVAFLFSDGGFYLLSGHFQPDWGDYWLRILQYAPQYLLTTFGYSVLLGLVVPAAARYRIRIPLTRAQGTP